MWKTVKNSRGDIVVYYTTNDIKRNDYACFDLDGTIITPKVGKFCNAVDDWNFKLAEIPKKIKEIVNSYKIVIITNQKGVELGKLDIDVLLKRLELVVKRLEVPIEVYISVCSGYYRKPHTGIWSLISDKCPSSESYYCGDMESDRMFAHNVGFNKFMMPEELFNGTINVNWEWKYNPLEYLEDLGSIKKEEVIGVQRQELILTIGYPASGKSFFAQKYFPTYIRVNQDTLKTKEKCLRAVKKALYVKDSVIVDNCNMTVELRQEYINIADAYGIPVRAMWFNFPKELCMHIDHFRVELSKGAKDPLPLIAFNRKKLEEPKLCEGFESIITIPFAWRMNPNDIEVFKMRFEFS